MPPSTRADDAAKGRLSSVQKNNRGIPALVELDCHGYLYLDRSLDVNGAGFDHPAEWVRKLAHLNAG